MNSKPPEIMTKNLNKISSDLNIAKIVCVCPACQSIVIARKRTRGSGWIELILWLWLIVPGVIYSIWRRSSSAEFGSCPTCGNKTIIPISSPMGKKLTKGREKEIKEVIEKTHEGTKKIKARYQILFAIFLLALVITYFFLIVR